MSNTITIQKYLETDVAKNIHKELKAMAASPNYITEPSYSPTSSEPVSFVDKHIKYLSTHQKLNHEQYLSNLKLMTKVR